MLGALTPQYIRSAPAKITSIALIDVNTKDQYCYILDENKTREEVARDYVTQAEVQRITDHIDQRFNRLEAKIDQLIQQAK